MAPIGRSLRQVEKVLAAGADSIFFGVRPQSDATSRLSILAALVEFDLAQAREAIALAHRHGRRAYVTLNSLYDGTQLDAVVAMARELIDAKADALIVADPGLVHRLGRLRGSTELHLSVVGRATNRESAAFWREQGVSRIILDRVIHVDEIRRIKQETGLELEVFVYGGFCFNHHGLCRLSSYFYGEMCLAPCMDRYTVDDLAHAGPTPFRSKQLNAYNALPELLEAGVDAVKIEGRQKSTAYITAVCAAFRRGIDALSAGEPLPDIPASLHIQTSPITTEGFYRGEENMLESIDREVGATASLRQLVNYLSPISMRFALRRQHKVREVKSRARQLSD